MSQENQKRNRRKLRETKVGQWAIQHAPQALELVAESLPFGDALQALAKFVRGNAQIPPDQRLEFERLMVEEERISQEAVTQRWQADMSSDVWLARNIRPLMLIAVFLLFLTIMIWDSVSESFIVKDSYVTVLESLLLVAFGAYFAGRSLEKGVSAYRRSN